MSNKAIRAALETALLSISPAIETAFVGVEFEPTSGVPYQEVFFFFADPDNAFISRQYIQRGYMQVILKYPPLVGTADITDRAELIQGEFPSGSVVSGVTISSTPGINEARAEDDRIVQSVFVNFLKKVQEA